MLPGVSGAAWGQNVGVFVEMSLLVLFATRPAVRASYSLGDWRLRWPEMKTLIRVGVPSGVQIVADVHDTAAKLEGLLEDSLRAVPARSAGR